MRIVIVGGGKVGSTLAAELTREGHDLVLIDNNSNALRTSTNTLDVIGVQGNGATYDVQKEAEVNKADLLIAVTSSDEVNMLSCLLAKKLGARHTIARIRNPEYSRQLMFLQDELGLSMAINPEQAAADEISRILRFPSAAKIDVFARGRVELVEFRINETCPLAGQQLSALYGRYRLKVLVCAVQRGGEVFIPGGDFVLQAGDKVHLTASPREISAFFKEIGLLKERVKVVLLIGGGKISYYLARQLSDMGMRVRIIERNAQRCIELDEKLPKVEIIHGDGTDQELLQEEGVAETGAFVALTDNDEENIILSMYANSLGVKKTVTKVNRLSMPGILSTVGLESVVLPKFITADQIVRYVRAMQNSVGSSIKTLHKIVNNQVEALEFAVREKAAFLHRPLKDLVLKENLLIACLIRKGQVIIPGGSDTIELGDNVIVITTNTQLRDLSDIIR